jgi:hypothetical protein
MYLLIIARSIHIQVWLCWGIDDINLSHYDIKSAHAAPIEFNLRMWGDVVP